MPLHIKMSDFSNFLDVQTKTDWERVLAEFASFCAPDPASLILDIGCGPGLLPAIFTQRGCKSFGVDYDFALLASGLVPSLVQADALALPFPTSLHRPDLGQAFDLVTATNVLFLLNNPLAALREWTRVLAPNGELCLLNPSENLSISAVTNLADSRGLNGTARESPLFWAHNAETYFCWTESETQELLAQAELQLLESVLRVGPGFARFVRAKLY